jgi:uncharacterized coiled-coil DUF342 family protein
MMFASNAEAEQRRLEHYDHHDPVLDLLVAFDRLEQAFDNWQQELNELQQLIGDYRASE